MDPAAIAYQAADILIPTLPLIYEGGKAIAEKGRDLLIWGGKEVAYKSKDMLLEKSIEKVSPEVIDRAKSLLKTLSPKMSESLEKVLAKLSKNSEDPKVREELQQEILKLIRENPDLAREIEIIVNINIDIDTVKQLIFGDNNLIFNLEGVKGEDLIKIKEYMDCKRQEELKQEVLKSYNPSVLPDFSETLVKFVAENRAEELSSALKHLQKNKILLFSGIAGVGKTTLARVLVNFRPTDVPEPFWFNFYHNIDAKLEDVLEALAAYLKAPEILSFKGKRQAGNTDINRLTEELRKRDSLWLVFDDLIYIIDEKRHFIDPRLGLLFLSFRDNTHNAKIILTSRVMPFLDNGEYLIDELEDENRQKIGGLKPDFAVNYLKANGFDNIKLKTLESLVKSVDGHPFSLKLLAGLAKKYTAEDILKDPALFRKHQKDRIKNARFLFNKLVGGEKELLERISVYRQPEPLEAFKIMFTDSVPVDSIDTLLDKSLLETDHNSSYWLHPLVQEFSYKDLKNKKEAHMLAVKYYLSLSLPEKPSRKEDLQPTVEAHYHACKAEEYDLAAHILWRYKLPSLLDLWGNSRTLIEIYEKLLPEDHLKDEPILKDKQVHEAVLGSLGLAYSHLGETRKAIKYYEQAMKISEVIGDRRREGISLGNLGLAYSNLGENRKAIEYYEQAMKIIKDLEYREGEGNLLGSRGLAYSHLGETRKAIEYYEQAMKISKEIRDRRGEGNNLGNLGLAYSNLGETRKAIEYHEQALKIKKGIGDRRGEGNSLGNLGLAYNRLGETRKAIKYHEQALKIAEEIGDRSGEGKSHANLGTAYIFLGEQRKAIEYYEQAMKIAKEIGDRHVEGNLLGNLGVAYSDQGEPRKAIEYHEQALKIKKEIGDKRGEGNSLGNLGLAYSNLGEPRKAIEYHEQGLKISKEIGDRREEGNLLGNLGIAYKNLGEPRKAIEFFKESLAIGRAIEDPRIISLCEQELKDFEGSDDNRNSKDPAVSRNLFQTVFSKLKSKK